MAVITTNVPARLDRLPWSRFHWTIVVGLGITWILDGLEVTIVGSVGTRLEDRATLELSPAAIGFAATAYLVGAVLGSLVFGYLTDRYGRKKLFLVTLAAYVTATVATAFSWNYESFLFFRFATGFAIGGEYAAINSTIDELNSGCASRFGGPGDQRYVLVRRDTREWGEHLAARSAYRRSTIRLAPRLRARRDPRGRDRLRARRYSGKSALAADARP